MIPPVTNPRTRPAMARTAAGGRRTLSAGYRSRTVGLRGRLDRTGRLHDQLGLAADGERDAARDIAEVMRAMMQRLGECGIDGCDHRHDWSQRHLGKFA